MDWNKRIYGQQEDFRKPFARDRDRVLHCSSFRRLEYKTQVFLNHEGDYFRTRLTHTLEVSQIARTLAAMLGLNETLAEVIALSHDLGHTPFGHAGGEELDRLLKDSGRTNGFEHNFQSFRVLTVLEKRYPEFDGLNLTMATLEGVLKHSCPYDKPFIPEWARESFYLDRHPSFEAVVVDHADEIAYTSHDIDDGIKYGLLDFSDMEEEPLAKRVESAVLSEGLKRGDYLFRHRFVAGLIKILVEDLISSSKNGIKKYKADSPMCSMLPADEPLPLCFSDTIKSELKSMKRFLFKKLYRHSAIAVKMYAGRECIGALWKAYNSDMDLLPERQRALCLVRNPQRVIADYIASMTDRYALRSYHEIYGISYR